MSDFVNVSAAQSGLYYQNDSPAELLVTIHVRSNSGSAKYASTANPLDEVTVVQGAVGVRTYQLKPQQGIMLDVGFAASVALYAAPLSGTSSSTPVTPP